MKKKIALLLAGVMAMSTLPMTSFAATSNTLNRVENISSETASTPNKVADFLANKYVDVPNVSLDYATQAPSTKGYIDLVIGNGEWESRGPSYDILVNAYMAKMADNEGSNANTEGKFPEMNKVAGSYDAIQAIDALLYELGKADDTLAITTGSSIYGRLNSALAIDHTYVTAYNYLNNTNLATTAITASDEFITVANALNDAVAANLTVASLRSSLSTLRTNNAIVYDDAKTNKIWFESRPIYSNTASLNIPVSVTGRIAVPIFYKIDSKSSNVTVTISNKNANASGGLFTVAQVVSGGTVTYAEGADNSKTATIFDIITKETVANKLAAGVHEVTYRVPSGFNFISVGGVDLHVDTPVVQQVVTDKMDLAAGDVATASVKYSTATSTRSIDVTYSIPSRGNNRDSELGAIKLEDVKITPDFGSNKYGDILMDVTSKKYGETSATTTSNTLISNQNDVKVGKYINWGIVLTAADSNDKPTELVSGYLEGNVNFTDRSSQRGDKSVFTTTYKPEWEAVGDMKRHETMEVKFAEVVPNSWWAGRETVFSVPEDVNIIQVEFTKVENIHSSDEVKTPGIYEGLVVDFADDEAPYVNIDGNKMTLQNLEVVDENEEDLTQGKEVKKKATIEMILWVASDVNYAGDIDLSVAGNAVPDQVDPLTIATTVVPYEVNTEVTNVEIGYQKYDVADITISETELGRFASAETIYFTIADSIDINGAYDAAVTTDGVAFRHANVEVVEGDLEIDSYYIQDDSLAVNVKYSSSKSNPSTIKLSNVTITMDRTVPQTNETPLQVVITSDNRTNIDLANGYEQTIRFGALHADYVHVKTLSFSNTNGQVVEVKAGDTTALVNGVETELDVPAFIDPATDSMMVPIRFVSVATGIDTENVIWDDSTKTVTVISGDNKLVQFKVGSSQYSVGGVYLPNDNGAVTQIVDSRAFVPFRTLGTSLNIPVSWDAATGTARFN